MRPARGLDSSIAKQGNRGMHTGGSQQEQQSSRLVFDDLSDEDSGQSVTFIHTADVQLGMRARHVAHAAEAVRAARLETCAASSCWRVTKRSILSLLPATCSKTTASGATSSTKCCICLSKRLPCRFTSFPATTICSGPASVYERDTFRSSQGNVHVLRSREPIPVAEGRPTCFRLPLPKSAPSVIRRLAFLRHRPGRCALAWRTVRCASKEGTSPMITRLPSMRRSANNSTIWL